MQYKFMNIKTIKTEKEGALSFFEGNNSIPFTIKRIYYISGVPKDAKRGAHAHKELRQFLFCPYGSVTLSLNNGKKTENVVLDDPSKGLLLEPGLWRDMIWNISNSVLCVAASEYYDEADYIRDYDEYLEYLESH